MISVDSLRKTYGEHLAVDGISFQAAKGEIFGLLGPNGAGKTTTISIISGLLEATSGSVLVDGRPMSPTASGVKKMMGVVPQDIALYEDLTARENLAFWGGLYDLGGAHWGGYAEYIRVPVGWVVPLPAGLSLQESMILGTAGFTAAQSVQALIHHGVEPTSGPVVVTGAPATRRSGPAWSSRDRFPKPRAKILRSSFFRVPVARTFMWRWRTPDSSR